MVVAFDQNATSPLDGLVNKAGTPLAGRTLRGGLVYAGQNGAPSHQGDPAALKVAPRLGVVYAISPRTVVRGGYGLFYAPWNYPFPSEENYGQRGYTQVTTLQQTFPRPITTLDNPFPNGLDPVTGNSAGLLTGVGGTVRFIDQNKQDPRVQQWSIDVQRELPGNMAAHDRISRQPRRQARPRRDERRGGQHQPARPGAPVAWDRRCSRRCPIPSSAWPRRAAWLRCRRSSADSFCGRSRSSATCWRFRLTEGKSRYNALTFQLDKRVSSGWGGRFGVHVQPVEGQPVRRDELLHEPAQARRRRTTTTSRRSTRSGSSTCRTRSAWRRSSSCRSARARRT